MTNTTTARPPSLDRSLHLQYACTLLVAPGAAYVSYRHGREFALRFGADATTATLWPLIVDGLVCHVALKGQSGERLWLLFGDDVGSID